MKKSTVNRVFLVFLIVAIGTVCYLIFEPFLIEIFIAAVIVSIFYKPYAWLTNKLGGRKKIASLLMCLVVILIVVIPTTNLIIIAAKKSLTAYSEVSHFLENRDLEAVMQDNVLNRVEYTLDLLGIQISDLKQVISEGAKKVSNWLVIGGTYVVQETANFIISLALIVFTMFFFFVDGEKMVRKIMHWTPLPNKHDREIFKKFREVSYSTVISTFVTAVAQGALGAIGFIIVGLPAFFPGIFMGFLSLLPYIGSGFVWVPAAIYLLIVGKIWQAIFMLAWGAAIVSMVDNLIRAYMIKGKSQVHPIFIIFSILGGISLFGFWGVILGPLLISLAVTILHIYELEYKDVLEK